MGLIVIKALEGCYGVFILPDMLQVQLLDGTTWDLRFRMFGVELMQETLLVLVTCQLVLLLCMPRFSSSSDLFDKLFTRGRSSIQHQPLSTLSTGETIALEDLPMNGHNEENEEESEEGELGSELPSDLSSLLSRAAKVASTTSPLVFFEAEEMA